MTKESYLQQIDSVIKSGTYKDNWQSLAHHRTPKWFTDRKFGIFIHYGIYSVPAFGSEWYSRGMYDENCREYQYHIDTYGNQKDFGYKDFIPMFTAEKFDAKEWASLFRQAGAGYVMPVAEHHDGFAMYSTEFNRWNAAEMGPKKDIVGELERACLEENLQFCASSHRAEHYFFMNMGRTFESDVTDAAYEDFYGPAYYCKGLHSNDLHATTANVFSMGPDEEYLEDWLVRTCELVDKYRPKMVYFDWWIHNHAFKPYLKKFAAYYYNRAEEWGEEVTINYKHQAFPPTVGTFDVERGALQGISPVPWQTDTAIGKHSWGYTKNNEFKGARQLLCDLIDIVSKNGNLLLNIGPKSDGTITEEEKKVLKDMGAWLAVNGEGIYGTTFWQTFGEGEVNAADGFFMDNEEKNFTQQDFRFTYKDGYLYAFQMRPDGKDIRIKSLKQRGGHDFLIRSVSILGSEKPVEYERTGEALIIHREETECSDLPLCVKIELD